MAFFVVGEGLTTHRSHTRRSTRYYYQRTLKVWIVLIKLSCTSRAIYLHSASSLDGLACIKVLQRFSSRYGQPKLR